RETPVQPPVILDVKLQVLILNIEDRSRALLVIGVEISQQRIRESVAGVQWIVGVGSEVEIAREQVAGRLEFRVRFIINASLELMVADNLTEVIFERPNRVCVEIVVGSRNASGANVSNGVRKVRNKSE